MHLFDVTLLQSQPLKPPPLPVTSFLKHADHFKAVLCRTAGVAHTTPPCCTNCLSPLWISLREEKKIYQTPNSVFAQATRGKLWLPELGGGQARVSLCAKETKALPLWPWTHTKQGAELLNGGVTAEDNHSCQFNEIALLLASVLDTHV